MKSLQDQLLDAIGLEKIGEVKSLLAAGASPDDPGSSDWTPLMSAAEMQNPEIVQLLLDAGADINKQGYFGQTCLHIAIDSSIDGATQSGLAEDPTETLELLLKRGADVEIKDDKGESPIDWARRSKKVLHLVQSYSRE